MSEVAQELFAFRDNLTAIGCDEELTSECIRLFGAHIPVFSDQLDGFYLRPDGPKERHFANPGWYSVLKVEGKTAVIQKVYVKTSHPFECGTFWLPATIAGNIEVIKRGHPLPDKSYIPAEFENT